MKIQWKYKNDLEIFETKGQESTPYLSFRALDDLGMVKNGFLPVSVKIRNRYERSKWKKRLTASVIARECERENGGQR